VGSDIQSVTVMVYVININMKIIIIIMAAQAYFNILNYPLELMFLLYHD